MTEHRKDIVISVLASDAFTLKAQWVYEAEAIDAIVGGTGDELADPPVDGFFKGKKAGDLTNHGDHMHNLLRYLAETHAFALDSYAQQWRSFFHSYGGYKDFALKSAYERLEKDGQAVKAPKKMLADTVGGVKFAPLFLLASEDENKLLQYAQDEAGLFYNSPFITDTITLVCYVMFAGLEGVHPYQALQSKDAPVSDLLRPLVQTGLDSAQEDTRKMIQKFGNACGVDGGLPGAVHLIAKYKDDPVRAHRENLRGTGDISGRALLYSSLVAPYFKRASVMQKWIDGITALSSIEHDMNRV